LGSWFHKECLKLDSDTDTTGDWFCSDECEEYAASYSEPDIQPTPENEVDYIRNYSISIVWNGLLDMAHRDGIREADGLMMMTMWRINMIRFWQGRHFNYMKVGHRLLTGYDNVQMSMRKIYYSAGK